MFLWMVDVVSRAAFAFNRYMDRVRVGTPYGSYTDRPVTHRLAYPELAGPMITVENYGGDLVGVPIANIQAIEFDPDYLMLDGGATIIWHHMLDEYGNQNTIAFESLESVQRKISAVCFDTSMDVQYEEIDR